MRHNYPEPEGNAHWAVGYTGDGYVLLQVQDTRGEQARIALTPEDALQVVAEINYNLALAALSAANMRNQGLLPGLPPLATKAATLAPL